MFCALAEVREAHLPDVGVVVLASQDSDPEPALDEGLRMGTAKIETFSWLDPAQPHLSRQLPPGGGRTLWKARLNAVGPVSGGRVPEVLRPHRRS